MNCSRHIENTPKRGGLLFTVHFLVSCFLCGQAFAHEDGMGDANLGQRSLSGTKTGPLDVTPCSVDPESIREFATGESSDFSSLLSFLTEPACRDSKLVNRALAGVDTLSKNPYPYRFENFVGPYLRGDPLAMKEVDTNLQERLPAYLRRYPLGETEILPILGQLSLLSPKAAKSVLAGMISNRLVLADGLLSQEEGEERRGILVGVNQSLKKWGASDPMLLPALTQNVEEMAVIAQAESLGKYLRSLAAIASLNSDYIGVFNSSAKAANRGVERGKPYFSKEQNSALLEALLSVLGGVLKGGDKLAPGGEDLNGALVTSLRGGRVSYKILKVVWLRALKYLAANPNWDSLAQILALNLTPEILFLPDLERRLLLIAALYHDEISESVQENFLIAHERVMGNLGRGTLSSRRFEEMKKRQIRPWLNGILDLGADRVSYGWLKQVLGLGLIEEPEVANRFPVFVLDLINRKDRSRATSKSGFIGLGVSHMAENLSVAWQLAHLHVPLLWRWVKDYDKPDLLSQK